MVHDSNATKAVAVAKYRGSAPAQHVALDGLFKHGDSAAFDLGTGNGISVREAVGVAR